MKNENCFVCAFSSYTMNFFLFTKIAFPFFFDDRFLLSVLITLLAAKNKIIILRKYYRSQKKEEFFFWWLVRPIVVLFSYIEFDFSMPKHSLCTRYDPISDSFTGSYHDLHFYM